MVATLSKATMQQLATAAKRGDRKALGDALTALTLGGGYATYAGNPSSNIVPDRVGEYCLDTTHLVFYRAYGLGISQWAAMGVPSAADFEYFDDFTNIAISLTGVVPDMWIAFAGGAGDATVAATTANVPEGVITIGSGAVNDATSGSVLSLINLARGSLVSLGTTIFETRVSFDALAGTSWNFGLSDILAEDTERSIFTIDSGTVADISVSSSSADSVMWGFSSDATATTKFQFCHMNNSVVGNSAAEDASANGPTTGTYDLLRIEINSDGDALFYLNGFLEKTELAAVRTSALLIPFIGGDRGTNAQAAVDVTIDLIRFSGARNPSN